MGRKFGMWQPRSSRNPVNYTDLLAIVRENRMFSPQKTLDYGDYGLTAAVDAVADAIVTGKRIALYADYDVDGTMSCVSWIWFFRAIGFDNFTHYIPDRFREGYGVNLEAVKHLISERGAQLIITMDTGITANEEAAFCKANGVVFICTDHHKIQPDKMPDCLVLNPKQHPDPAYQELCGCGITFVLLRKLAARFAVPADTWNDILALVGMATICDVVPLNGVNHRIVKLGVEALHRSRRPILRKLLQACSSLGSTDEKDVGFRLGPRINAVGRLEHAHAVIDAFVSEDPSSLVLRMGECNDRRKLIQQNIVAEADALAQQHQDDPLLFLGGDWHPGVVGIAASKIAEKHWKPTWLFNRDPGLCRGSARSIQGFDVTEAMAAAKDVFVKFGGHRAAGGFAFEVDDEGEIRRLLLAYAEGMRQKTPEIWQSKILYDCQLPGDLLAMDLAECLDDLKPFGHGFEEPLFALQAEIAETVFYNDKQTGLPKHTAVFIKTARGQNRKIMFFNEVHHELQQAPAAQFLVSAGKNHFRGVSELSLYGHDFQAF